MGVNNPEVTAHEAPSALRWTQSPTDLGSSFAILNTLIATSIASNPNTTLNTATRMWIAKTLTVVPAYGQAVEHDFSGAMGLLIVMPTGDMNTFVQTLDANALEALQAGFNPNLLQPSVPPFSVTQALASITAILQAMGLSISLSDQADFVVFDPNSAAPEKIASIFEQATIQADKNGTLAVAAAGVVATPTGVGVPPGTPILCTIDHPYLYFLHDTITNTILFMGDRRRV